MAISTISTDFSHGIRLGTGNYASQLTVTNTGVVSSPSFGVYSNLADTILVNDGSIHAGLGVAFLADSTGSTIINSGSIYGVTIAAGMLAGDTLINHGAISGGTTYGIGVQGNSTLENEGTISSGTLGVLLASGSVQNSGTIHAGVEGLALEGGLVTNTGTISGNTIGIGVEGGSFTNFGVISGNGIGADIDNDTTDPYALLSTGTIKGDVAGLFLAGAGMKNEGLIVGITVGAALYINSTMVNTGTVEGVNYGIYFENAVLTNLGTITSGRYAVDGYGAFTLNVYGSSVFNGKVHDQTGTGTLNLLGPGPANMLSGIGTQFTGFDDFNFTAKSFWTLQGDTTGLAAGQTIGGLAAGDAIILDGFAATSETYVAGTGIVLHNGASTEILNVSNLSPDVSLTLASASGNSTITAAISTISTYVSTGTYGASQPITLGAGGYTANLTVTSTGTVATPIGIIPTPAFYAASGTKAAAIDNAGVIDGIDAKSAIVIDNHNDIDDYGIRLDAGGSIVNSGFITGGANPAISLTNGGTIVNSGTIGGTVADVIPPAIEGSGAISLIIDPGAVFKGAVSDNSGNGQLILAGTGPGHLDLTNTGPNTPGINPSGYTSFSGFSEITFATGADWSLQGNTSQLSAGETITGFAPSDTLVLDGFAATSETYVAGVGIVLNNGAGTETLGIDSLSPNISLTLSTAADNSTITAAISTISTSIETGTFGAPDPITLGAGGYAASLTITAAGTVTPPLPETGFALPPVFYVAPGTPGASIDNDGVIGPIDAEAPVVIDNRNLIANGAAGIFLGNGGTVFNTGTIIGQYDGISLAAGGTITNAGTIAGRDFGLLPAIDGAGRISLIIDPGTVFDGAVIDSSDNGQLILSGTGLGSLNLDAIGALGAPNTVSGFSEITIATGADWLLQGNMSQLAAGETITGFAAGDAIILDDFAATSKTYISGIGLVLGNGTTTETLNIVGTYTSDEYVISNEGSGTEITAPCFAAGTRIATASGNRRVETLKIGDLVRTQQNGLRPVKWIGSRHYEGAFCTGKHLLLPIRIRRHAIGFNIPSRDLIVSPDHALRLGNALVPAWRLVNGVSITQAKHVDSLSYFHIELESHDILLAENCPAESFLDAACRHRFHNAAGYKRLYPGFSKLQPPCLPRLEHGFALQAIQQHLASRAGIKPTPTPTGPLRGVIDEMSKNLMRGWAQDATAPEQPVSLILTQHGQPIARLLANRYRHDLRAAGLGSGCHAFEMALPKHAHGSLELRRATDGALLATTAEWPTHD